MGRPVDLVVATHNRDKGGEIMALLGDLPVRLHGLWEWNQAPEIAETGASLTANAILKAEAAVRLTGMWAVADDTGLEVDALDGAPGVYSARYAGDSATYADNRARLLDALGGQPPPKRGARFRTVIALARPGGPTETVAGVVEGFITTAERGEEGFGYDAIFHYPPAGKTFAEMTPAEKNAVSHRGRALRAFKERLYRLLETGSRSGRPE